MNHPSTPSHRLRIVDAHVHFYDSDVNRHGFLDQKDDVYEALVGDYSSLPKTICCRTRPGKRELRTCATTISNAGLNCLRRSFPIF
jgi:hypothetical protein